MKRISNFKRVQSVIRERTSNNKLIIIFSFVFAFVLILSTIVYPNINYTIKAKVIDYSSGIINSLYSPINTVNKSVTNLYNIINVHNLNKKLTFENQKYKLISNELIILKNKNNEYRELLNISKDIEYKFVTAKIISKSNLAYTKSVILMSGKNNNIRNGSPVTFDKSLIGYINDVGNTSSRLVSITDALVKIPAIIVDKNLKIILSGNNNKYLEILNISDITLIKEGDKVFTSGDGNKFPENLFVGTIRKKKNGDFIIEPSFDLNSLNYVNILDWSLKNRGIDIKTDPIFYD